MENENIEPTCCRECPFWSESQQLPNVGYCKIYDDKTLGHDKPNDLCDLKFWDLAESPLPAIAL